MGLIVIIFIYVILIQLSIITIFFILIFFRFVVYTCGKQKEKSLFQLLYYHVWFLDNFFNISSLSDEYLQLSRTFQMFVSNFFLQRVVVFSICVPSYRA